MISTDTTFAGVRTATPPAVGLPCSGATGSIAIGDIATGSIATGSTAGTVRYAGPVRGTSLPATGATARLRALIAGARTTGFDATGAPFGTDELPALQESTVQQPAMAGPALAGVPARHISSTPGDLPPEDPLG